MFQVQIKVLGLWPALTANYWTTKSCPPRTVEEWVYLEDARTFASSGIFHSNCRLQATCSWDPGQIEFGEALLCFSIKASHETVNILYAIKNYCSLGGIDVVTDASISGLIDCPNSTELWTF